MESLTSIPFFNVARSICKTWIFATAGGGGNTAITLESWKQMKIK